MASGYEILADPRCDRAAVRRDVLEQRAEMECRIAQIDAEVRASCRPPRRMEQEALAAASDNIDACDELLAYLDELDGA